MTVPPPEDKPTLTVGEAAELLGVGRSTIYASIKTGDIPVIAIGRRKIIPTAAFLRLFGEDAEKRSAPETDQLGCRPGEMNFDGRIVRPERIGRKHGFVFLSVEWEGS